MGQLLPRYIETHKHTDLVPSALGRLAGDVSMVRRVGSEMRTACTMCFNIKGDWVHSYTHAQAVHT